MNAVELRATPFALPLRRPLAIGGATVAVRHGIVLELVDAHGRVGLGEIAPPPASAAGDVAAIMRRLVGAAPLPTRLAALVRAAVDTAVLDGAAREAGLPVAALLGGAQCTRLAVNALLGSPAVTAAVVEARALVASGYRCIKLKLTCTDPTGDMRRLAAVRAAVGDAVALRADANAAWSVGDAIVALRRLAPCGLEYVEQPVATIAGLAAVRAAVSVPIAADESVVDAASVERIAAARAADLIVVKPAVLGLGGAAATVRTALRCGLDVVVTSALDSSVGIAAGLQLAATLPEPRRACGLGTAALLAGDLVTAPLRATGGSLALRDGPGLGVALDVMALRGWQTADAVECVGRVTRDLVEGAAPSAPGGGRRAESSSRPAPTERRPPRITPA